MVSRLEIGRQVALLQGQVRLLQVALSIYLQRLHGREVVRVFLGRIGRRPEAIFEEVSVICWLLLSTALLTLRLASSLAALLFDL